MSDHDMEKTVRGVKFPKPPKLDLFYTGHTEAERKAMVEAERIRLGYPSMEERLARGRAANLRWLILFGATIVAMLACAGFLTGWIAFQVFTALAAPGGG